MIKSTSVSDIIQMQIYLSSIFIIFIISFIIYLYLSIIKVVNKTKIIVLK